MLKDTKLTAVFATEFKRTQQTAAPTAAAQHVTVTTVKADQTAELVQKLKTAKGAVLVVGHSNTVPEVMTALGVKPAVTIADDEFDNLFIVTTGAQPRDGEAALQIAGIRDPGSARDADRTLNPPTSLWPSNRRGSAFSPPCRCCP